jgi:hypothetical protein
LIYHIVASLLASTLGAPCFGARWKRQPYFTLPFEKKVVTGGEPSPASEPEEEETNPIKDVALELVVSIPKLSRCVRDTLLGKNPRNP